LDRRTGLKKYPIVIGILFLVFLILIVGFPTRKPLRDILRPFTFFDRFFEGNAYFLSGSMKKNGDEGGPLYRKFFTNLREAGDRVEGFLTAAWNPEAYYTPLMAFYMNEYCPSEEIQTTRKGGGIPRAAYSSLASPRPIHYGGVRAEEIQMGSRKNWERLPSLLREHLSELLCRSLPAATFFREMRGGLEMEMGKEPFAQVLARNRAENHGLLPPANILEEAIELSREVDLTQVWRCLLAYCEGLDRVVREVSGHPYTSALSPLPGDDWFPEGILYTAYTPFGLVVVGGSGDNVYPAGDVFLLVDLGGNDAYFFDECFYPREQGGRPVHCATLLDLDGDDQYRGASGSVAAGVLGFRTILDLEEGRDLYETEGLGLGAGVMGLGLLLDAGGADKYILDSFGLGAAAYGVGVLVDGGGDDMYRGTLFCQGFAGPMGLGCLLDESGDDTYHCFPLLSGPHSESFLSENGSGFAQGCSAVPAFASGSGIGVLLDLCGDDSYRCTALGQGAARGRGFALLLDARGHDFFNGRDRCQGFGDLGGVGLLRDLEGSDHYLAGRFGQGMGCAGSLGLLIDDLGDDRYTAMDRSQGRNQSTGTGMLFDGKGKDRFLTRRDD
jgi:hypothetical protein